MFSNPSNPLHVRNGGLIGLAGTAIALGVEIAPYMEKFIEALLICFTDPENRVRYFSAECLYNIAKVSKGEILVYFNPIFDALSKVRLPLYTRITSHELQHSLLQTPSFLSRMGPNCWIACSRISLRRPPLSIYPIIPRRRRCREQPKKPLTITFSSRIRTTSPAARTSVAHAKHSLLRASYPCCPREYTSSAHSQGATWSRGLPSLTQSRS